MQDYRQNYGQDYGVVSAADTVRIERMLPGPVERLWQYLVDPERRALWLASGDMLQRAGDRVEFVFRNSGLSEPDDKAPEKYAAVSDEARMQASVILCEPPRLLSMTWGSPSGEDSEVCFELIPRDEQVLLVVTHSRLPDRDEMLSVASGWHTHLEILAARLQGVTPPSFWRRHSEVEAEYERRIPH